MLCRALLAALAACFASVAVGGSCSPLVVIAGPPGAGKGTQCQQITERFGYVHISTGDILRQHVRDGTELGKIAEGYMQAGGLVPSELMVDVVKARLAHADVQGRGCLLDGFPRTAEQARALASAGLAVERFLLLEVADSELLERALGRRLDPATGNIYHLTFKPPPQNVTHRLVHRSDDQEEAIRKRLRVYRAQIDAVLPHFEGAASSINGSRRSHEVAADLFAALGSSVAIKDDDSGSGTPRPASPGNTTRSSGGGVLAAMCGWDDPIGKPLELRRPVGSEGSVDGHLFPSAWFINRESVFYDVISSALDSLLCSFLFSFVFLAVRRISAALFEFSKVSNNKDLDLTAFDCMRSEFARHVVERRNSM